MNLLSLVVIPWTTGATHPARRRVEAASTDRQSAALVRQTFASSAGAVRAYLGLMLRMSLVGSVTMSFDDVVLEPPASRRAWLLLAWLGLHPGLHARGEVAATFWPDVLDSSARASLRSAVWALRKALADRADDYLHLDRERIGLRPEAPVRVDVAALDELSSDAELAEAVGVLLPGYDDEWVIEARDAHRARVVDLLESRAELAEREGDPAAAVRWTRQQIGLDPLAEEPVQRLMRRLAAAGDRAAALTAYRRFREKLARELQIRPAVATRELAEDLRSRVQARPQVRAARQDWPLIGRAREVDDLTSVWARSRGGRLMAAAITGEPGIGKTRLADELCDLAGAEGALVASATALDLGVTTPFGIWAELIGSLTSSLEEPPRDARWTAGLAPLTPGFASGQDRPPAHPAAVSPDLERARLYEATVGLLQWASRDRPVLLLMEDMHAADVASLVLIGYVCRRLAGSPMLLVLTRRPLPHAVQVDALEQSLRARHVLTTELALTPLAGDDAAHLVRQVAALPDDRVEQVVAAADGNPLLAVEWAAALGRGEHSPPDSLRASVRTALAPVLGDALELARFAAIAGRSLERDEVDRLPLASPREAVATASECSLLATQRGRVGYRHALLREAAYVDLSDPVRERLHETFGRVLAGLGDQVAAEAARHLRLAGRDDLAVPQLVRAAGHARTVAALPEAASLLEEALGLEPQQAHLLVDLAEIEALRVHAAASDELFARAVAVLTDPTQLADAWVRRARWYAGALCNPLRTLDAARRAVEVMDAGEVEAPELRVEALARWSWAESVAGDVGMAERLLGQVHSVLGQERASDAVIPAIGHARALALLRRGQFRDSYGPEISAAEASRRLGRPDLSYGAWSHAACAAACAGDFDRALDFVDRGLADLADSGFDILVFHLLAGRAHALGRLGRAEDALRAARQQRGLAQRLGSDSLLALADHDRGLLALQIGRPGEAAELLRAALERPGRFSRPTARLLRAEALLTAGRLDDAEEEVRLTALEPVGPGDIPDALVPRMTRVQGLIARGRGDEDLAQLRLGESADGWRRLIRRSAAGDHLAAAIADFGRPPVVGMVEPARELDRVLADLRRAAPVSPSRS
jgi:DNA-binding SARP family transcriptional activator/tetratricopeptide (TPR) repeat protein